jgi:hypothetical protein
MRIKGATTVLNNRAKFYGKTVEWLVEKIDNGFDETQNVLKAHKEYKRNQEIWNYLEEKGYRANV